MRAPPPRQGEDAVHRSRPSPASCLSSTQPNPHGTEMRFAPRLRLQGNRGRTVASLEEMCFTTSTAWTGRIRTCYSFQTSAGIRTFLRLFGAKLEVPCPTAYPAAIRPPYISPGPAGVAAAAICTIFFRRASDRFRNSLPLRRRCWRPTPLTRRSGGRRRISAFSMQTPSMCGGWLQTQKGNHASCF